MAIGKKFLKKTVRVRPKTGIAAAPLIDDFYKLKFYFHYELEVKEISSVVKPWVKATFSKEDAKAILANPEYHFTMHPHFASCIYWSQRPDAEFPEPYKKWFDVCKAYYADLIQIGNAILIEKAGNPEEPQSNVVKLNPYQRTINKINDTVMQDILDLEDKWLDGDNKATVDLYQKFKSHGLSGAHVDYVRKVVDQWIEEYQDAYSGLCEQATEAYKHVTKPALKARIKTCEGMLSDLDKIKSAAKATRKARVKKPQAADKQVSKLTYCKEDNEFKIVSIIPAIIVGAMRLYVFNVKTRELTEYVSESVNGFEVKGTSLQNFGGGSRKVRLRKPDEFLSIVQSKTSRQIDNEWQKLTTKTSEPTGRINKDCVLLRVSAS
jgi:hypothetical protein